jgi:hypothetical protein
MTDLQKLWWQDIQNQDDLTEKNIFHANIYLRAVRPIEHINVNSTLDEAQTTQWNTIANHTTTMLE